MELLIRLGRVVAIIGMLAALNPRAVVTAQTTIETDVKATFLYNFTRFIEWPADPAAAAAPAGGSPFRICAIANAAMEEAIRRAVEGEVVGDRPLVMTRPQRPEEAATCQILFVSRSQEERGAALVAAVRDLPVLTVSDSADFVEHGGTIGFVLVNNRVRFDVNLPAAQRARLKVSANLLRVARKVEPIR